MSKQEAFKHARQEYVSELYLRNVIEVTERFRRIREEMNELDKKVFASQTNSYLFAIAI
jgi:hypothetical protein